MNIEQATDVEHLKKWQDSVMENAKRLLLKDGELQPLFMVLTERMNIPQHMLQAIMLIDPVTMQVTSAMEGKPNDVIIVTMTTIIPSELAIQILLEKYDDPKFRMFVEQLNTVGLAAGVEHHHDILLKSMLRVLGLEFQDVVAMAIQLVLRKMDAAAIIKIDECWVVMKEQKPGDKKTAAELRAEVPEDLKDDPTAEETIVVSLESDGFYRMISTVFHRNKPETGEIIGFDDVKVITEPGNDSMKMSGRFTHLLRKAKSRPKPQPQPGAQ